MVHFTSAAYTRFAVAPKHSGKAYRPVSAEMSLTETVCIKHTRKVARDNTVKYHWRLLQLLREADRPSYAGLLVDLGAGQWRADHQVPRLDRRFSGGTASLVGAVEFGRTVLPRPGTAEGVRRSRRRTPQRGTARAPGCP